MPSSPTPRGSTNLRKSNNSGPDPGRPTHKPLGDARNWFATCETPATANVPAVVTGVPETVSHDGTVSATLVTVPVPAELLARGDAAPTRRDAAPARGGDPPEPPGHGEALRPCVPPRPGALPTHRRGGGARGTFPTCRRPGAAVCPPPLVRMKGTKGTNGPVSGLRTCRRGTGSSGRRRSASTSRSFRCGRAGASRAVTRGDLNAVFFASSPCTALSLLDDPG